MAPSTLGEEEARSTHPAEQTAALGERKHHFPSLSGSSFSQKEG